MNATLIHPTAALATNGISLPIIPVCVHYAGNERFIKKAFELQKELGPVFDLTCDLEDGAPEGSELTHAVMVTDLLRSAENHYRMAGVRVHGPRTEFWQAEIDQILSGAGDLVSYLVIPKVRELSELQTVLSYIDVRARELKLSRTIPVHVLIETPQALEVAGAIAALPQVVTLDFGLLDFISDHGGAIPASAMRSPAQFEHKLIVRAKTEIAAAALMNGVVPVHNITLELTDGTQAYLDARRAREEFGFLRMWSIHPVQIKPIVEAMTPTFAELNSIEEILIKAQRKDWSPMSVDGVLHDKASYRYFWDSLCRARLSGMSLSPETEELFFSRHC